MTKLMDEAKKLNKEELESRKLVELAKLFNQLDNLKGDYEEKIVKIKREIKRVEAATYLRECVDGTFMHRI